MVDGPTATSEKAEEGKKALDPSKFAYISDRTYTAHEVEQMTAVVQRFTSPALRTAPNAKMFLRSYWYRSVQAGTMGADEMHIYTLARCRSVPLCPPMPVWLSTTEHQSGCLTLGTAALLCPLVTPTCDCCDCV